MNIDLAKVDPVLNAMPYPCGKDNLVQTARQQNMNQQIMNILERLPNKTFNSAQEVKNEVKKMAGGLGGTAKP